MSDIVLLTVDSLRADHVGWHGYDRPTTPCLDELVPDAHVFENAFAHAGATRPSFPSILTSSYDQMYGGPERITDERTVVAEPLQAAGYHTAGFHSNLYLSADFGYDRGFDHFFDAKSEPSAVAKLRHFVKQRLDEEGRLFQFLKSSFDATEKHAGVELGSAYESATDLTDRVVDWVETTDADDDHFLWAHYMDVHHPYLPPAEHQRPFRDDPIDTRRATKLRRRMLEKPETLDAEERQALVDLYDAEIRYMDAEVDRLLDTVRAEWGDDVVVLFTADHGEEFEDHGGYSHGTLHDEGVHVPLLLADGTGSGRYEEMVGLLDLAPTIADYAGVEPGANWHGYSLKSLVEGGDWERNHVVGGWGNMETGDREFFYRDREWKYLDDENGEQLYDITEDPGETENVVETYPERRSEFADTVEAHRTELRENHRELEEVAMDEQTKERLAMLGYKEE